PRWQRRMDHQHEGSRRSQRNRFEILLQIVVELLVEGRADHDRSRGEQQGVAVRRRVRRAFRPDMARGACAVVDDELLTERFIELGCDEARDDIDARSGWERGDYPHRLAWIALPRRASTQQREEAAKNGPGH